MEALTAHVQSVFTDETMTVAAGSAGPRSLPVLLGVRIPDVSKTHFAEIIFG